MHSGCSTIMDLELELASLSLLVLFQVFPLILTRFSFKKRQVGSIKVMSPSILIIQAIKTNTHRMQCIIYLDRPKDRFYSHYIVGWVNCFIVSYIARTLHLPTCNVMKVALVQLALFVLYSQQESIKSLWAMSWRVHH